MQQQVEFLDQKHYKQPREQRLRLTGCIVLTIDGMKVSLVPGRIVWDKNVLGQEQEKGGREDLFLD